MLATLHASIPSDFGGGASLQKVMTLMELIRHQRLTTVVEIGVYRGRCLVGLALAVQELNGLTIGIDPYTVVNANEEDLKHEVHLHRGLAPAGGVSAALVHWLQTTDFDQVYREVVELMGDRAVIIRQPAAKAVEEVTSLVKDGIHLLHIDGNHDTVRVCEDIVLYVPLVVSGGYVVMSATDFLSVQKGLCLLRDRGCGLVKDYGEWQLWRKG